MTDEVDEMSAASRGLRSPAAWIAFATDGSESSAVYPTKEKALATARKWGWQIAPLYPFPALWPEDEIAIEAAWERCGLTPTWPDDEPQTGVRCANAMAEAIQRLRLTDAEREAIEYFAGVHCRPSDSHNGHIATLLGLLERTRP